MSYIPRRYGWIRDVPKLHHPVYELRRKVAPEHRPPVIDFRQNGVRGNVPFGMPPILDQQIGDCTANSIAGIIRYLQMKQKLARIFTPSRLAIYCWERALSGAASIATDAGATIEDQMTIVKTIGAPDEALWPYDVTKFTVEPPASVRKAAKTDIVPGPQEFLIDTGINGIMDSLEDGFPIDRYHGLRFIRIPRSRTYRHRADAYAEMPWYNFWSKAEKIAGGHAIWMAGYNQMDTATDWGFPPRSVMCVNSWSQDWGCSGYFFLSFDYINNPDLAGPFYSVKLVTES